MTSLFESVARDIDATQGVDQALMRFCRILSHVLPVEGAFVGKHLPNSHQVLYVARASIHESQPMHIYVPIHHDVQRYLSAEDRPEGCAYPLRDFPAMTNLNKSLIPVDRTFMEIRLRAGETPIGMIGIYAAQGQKFDHVATQQVLDVRKPLAQTMAMHLFKKGLFALPDHWAIDFHMMPDDNTGMAAVTSQSMKNVLQKIDTLAPLPHTVLLLGETGVGKEVMARRLHTRSRYRDGPFIHVNCAALPELLADSELFGHERGSFTGADQRHMGFFEQANGGTIFLDEIGELPISLQARLLLTLQDKTIYRLGGKQRIPLDFRLIAATNRNLNDMAATQGFRSDLLYRLNALTIEVPALRHRREDIPALMQHFMLKSARALGMIDAPDLPDALLKQWMSYNWPGNVRELSNQIEQMLIFGESNLFTPQLSATPHLPQEHSDSSLQRLTQAHIQKVLEQTQGRVAGAGGAAEILQVHPSTLRSRMKKFGISYGRRYSPL